MCYTERMTDLYDYQGRGYSRVEGKGVEELASELRVVFDGYPEYANFDAMVLLFASDDFYHLHFVAQRYMHLLQEG